MADGQARTRNKSAASLLSRTAAEPLRGPPGEGVIDVGAAKTTPRRAMDDTTTDAVPGSGKTATNVPADAAEEGATDDVVLGVETAECCRGTNRTEA